MFANWNSLLSQVCCERGAFPKTYHPGIVIASPVSFAKPTLLVTIYPGVSNMGTGRKERTRWSLFPFLDTQSPFRCPWLAIRPLLQPLQTPGSPPRLTYRSPQFSLLPDILSVTDNMYGTGKSRSLILEGCKMLLVF